MANHFVELAAVDVGKHIEKKGDLSYLSWAWAVDQLLRRDPTANWKYSEPATFGETMMVVCTVTAFGIPRTQYLPVMDHRNKAIANPDAFQVNTAMQRCLVKAIALHGLGLYIYAGEDLPPSEDGDKQLSEADQNAIQALKDAALNGIKALNTQWKATPEKVRERIVGQVQTLKLKEAAAAVDELENMRPPRKAA